jgi:hypothetical protein
MISKKITCDNCQADLTYTNNYMEWYLTLGTAAKEKKANVSYLMNIEPILRQQKQFCGFECLKQWIENHD